MEKSCPCLTEVSFCCAWAPAAVTDFCIYSEVTRAEKQTPPLCPWTHRAHGPRPTARGPVLYLPRLPRACQKKRKDLNLLFFLFVLYLLG